MVEVLRCRHLLVSTIVLEKSEARQEHDDDDDKETRAAMGQTTRALNTQLLTTNIDSSPLLYRDLNVLNLSASRRFLRH